MTPGNTLKMNQAVFYFRRTRAQRSRVFINMGVMCWIYIGALHAYGNYARAAIVEPTRSIVLWSLVLASLALFGIAGWRHRHRHRRQAAALTVRS